MGAIVIVDERTATPESPFGTKIKAALDAGARVRLRPAPAGGFDMVWNGGAILCTDLSGTPVGTYGTLTRAVHAWRVKRGVAPAEIPQQGSALFLDEVDW